LPRLGLVQRAGYKLAEFDHVIVNHADRQYQIDTLSRFGISPDRIIRATENVFRSCESLVVPSLKANHQTLPAADLAFLRESFPGAGHSVPRHRRIFLSRSDARFRRLTNEAELYPLLRAHDFEIISPSRIDVASQAKLFSEAAVIVGTAGAAFANLVFASAPAHVIEISPPQWLAAFHWMISARSRLSHTVLLGKGPIMRGVPDSSARQLDVTLSPEKLARFLEAKLVPAAGRTHTASAIK
ncbi:MAG TPA: glycosyltransferase family 61 protein, partial [Opitutus sp.]|nr:glycosyltransferase family 61 protein [Opitutus sp.]